MTKADFIKAVKDWPDDADIYMNKGFGNAIESRNTWYDQDRNAIIIG